jgi:hypothetical protein
MFLENPYRFKSYRKMIDSAAFLIYGHWIKKDENQNQNRATLFQTEEKCDLVRHEQQAQEREDLKSRPLQRQIAFEEDKLPTITSS